MKKTVDNIFWTVLALAAALLMLLLTAPQALADGVDSGTDAIEIAEDGTVTLVSGHAAGEGVSSVQFQLRLSGEAGFSFADLGSRLTYCTQSDGMLHIYIAGSEPLMGSGTTRLVVGTVTGDVQSVEPVQESLQYVYGRRTVAQNVPEAVRMDSMWEQLLDVLNSANAEFGAAHMYSDESWGVLNSAIDHIEQLLDKEDLQPQDVTEAIAAYDTAKSGLQLAGKDELEELMAESRDVDASLYTAGSYAALQAAVSGAESALNDPDPLVVAGAVQRLREALSGLVEQQWADSSGSLHGDPRDGGSEPQASPEIIDEPAVLPTPEADTPTDLPAAPASLPGPTATAAPAAASGAAPGTGDDTPVLLWMAVLCLAGGALAVLALRRGKSGR